MNFSKMWKLGAVAVAVAGVAGLCACEWGAGSDATSWSDSFNWVNFSGTYRLSGTKTVAESSTKTTGAAIENKEIYDEDGHLIGIVTVTNYTGTDKSSATYTSSSQSSFTGAPYTVIQQGQNLTITDGKTGAIMKGKFTSMRSASGYENAQAVASGAQAGVQSAATVTSPHGLPKGGDTIIGSFEVKGDAGRMVGTFQGTVYDTNTDGTGDVFGNRTLTATFVGLKKTTQIEATCLANSGITVFYMSSSTNGSAAYQTE